MRAALFRLNAIEYCFRFSKERRGAYFCPTSIEGGALSSIYGLDSIWLFYYICDQFVLHLIYFNNISKTRELNVFGKVLLYVFLYIWSTKRLLLSWF